MKNKMKKTPPVNAVEYVISYVNICIFRYNLYADDHLCVPI